MTAKWLDTVEVAKLIRKELAVRFPGVKFSVTSSKYSMGSSINVKWTDGPTANQVDEVVGRFEGADFDSMQDMKISRDAIELNGEMVKMGVDYIHTNRNMSDATLRMFADAVGQAYGIPPQYKTEFDGSLCVEDTWNDRFPGNSINTAIYREFCQWSENDGAIKDADDLPSMKRQAVDYEAWLLGCKKEVEVIEQVEEAIKQLQSIKVTDEVIEVEQPQMVLETATEEVQVQKVAKPKAKRTRKPKKQLTWQDKVRAWLIVKLGGKVVA